MTHWIQVIALCPSRSRFLPPMCLKMAFGLKITIHLRIPSGLSVTDRSCSYGIEMVARVVRGTAFFFLVETELFFRFHYCPFKARPPHSARAYLGAGCGPT